MGKRKFLSETRIKFLKILIENYPNYVPVAELKKKLGITHSSVRTCYLFWSTQGIKIKRKKNSKGRAFYKLMVGSEGIGEIEKMEQKVLKKVAKKFGVAQETMEKIIRTEAVVSAIRETAKEILNEVKILKHRTRTLRKEEWIHKGVFEEHLRRLEEKWVNYHRS